MLRSKRSQCVIISGESGSGKTETTKHLVRQIVEISRAATINKLEDRILQVNPLLEAFGNAQTSMNSNSSRFGKFIELGFDKNGSVVGASISHYLLEKSRVVGHAYGERNFHIFYYLLAGVQSSRKKYNLTVASDYRYLRSHAAPSAEYAQATYVGGAVGSGSQPPPAPEDTAETRRLEARSFGKLDTLMEDIGFTPPQREHLSALLAAILHLGNIEFKSNDRDEAVVSNDKAIRHVAEIFDLPIKDIGDALTIITTVTGGDTIKRHVTVEQAVEARDAMAKIMYQFIFGWIVRFVNKLFMTAASIAQQTARAVDAAADGDQTATAEAVATSKAISSKMLGAQRAHAATVQEAHATIGILDIFGFENFARNSFEQLCINTANESLANYFIQHVFKWEQDEYAREGIQWQHVSFLDNQECLSLLTGRPIGIFAVLDEESHFPRASDQSFIAKLTYQFGKHPYFIKHPKLGTDAFIVNHFASRVSYDATFFLEKNRDTVPEAILQLLRSTNVSLLDEILESEPSLQVAAPDAAAAGPSADPRGVGRQNSNKKVTRGNSKKLLRAPSKKAALGTVSKAGGNKSRVRSTVAMIFRESLAELMKKVGDATPHFVRCIKPNAGKVHGLFDKEYILLQLSYAGVLDTVRVRRQGYALRISFDDFVSRYKVTAFRLSDPLPATPESCSRILNAVVGPEGWQIGISRVFVKAQQTERLDAIADEFFRKIVVVQKATREALARLQFARLAQKRREEEERIKQQQRLEEEQRLAEEQRLLEEERIRQIEAELARQQETFRQEQLKQERLALQAEMESRLAQEQERQAELDRNAQSFLQMDVDYQNLDDSGNVLSREYNPTNRPPSPRPSAAAPEIAPRIPSRGASLLPPAERHRRTMSVGPGSGSQTDLPHPLSEEQIYREMIEQQLWYHGMLSRTDAERKLASKNVGTFLVRVADNQMGFCISLRRPEGCKHYPVAMQKDRFWVIGEEADNFASLLEVVEHYRFLTISTDGDRLMYDELVQEQYGYSDQIDLVSVARVRRNAQIRADCEFAQQIARQETARAKRKMQQQSLQAPPVAIPSIPQLTVNQRPLASQPTSQPSIPQIVLGGTSPVAVRRGVNGPAPVAVPSMERSASPAPYESRTPRAESPVTTSLSYMLKGEELEAFNQEIERIKSLLRIEARMIDAAEKLVKGGTMSKHAQNERVMSLEDAYSNQEQLTVRLREMEAMGPQARVEWAKKAIYQRNFDFDSASSPASSRSGTMSGRGRALRPNLFDIERVPAGLVTPTTPTTPTAFASSPTSRSAATFNYPSSTTSSTSSTSSFGSPAQVSSIANVNRGAVMSRPTHVDAAPHVQSIPVGTAQLVTRTTSLASPDSTTSLDSVTKGVTKKRWAKNNPLQGNGINTRVASRK
ncbi:myosin IIIA, variant [Capsaspora owczarzaki ATCC 30864]|nr:myosin IIIA, variant [Capsaspora owczarzaki ATCC 30864]